LLPSCRAVIRYLIAKLEGDETNGWISDAGLDQGAMRTSHWTAHYLASIYFAFTTLTTVGYGDISAHTNWERAFALLAVLTGAVFFASIINKVCRAPPPFCFSSRCFPPLTHTHTHTHLFCWW
jgi:hypothetical protein